MAIDVRKLTGDDAEASRRLGWEAFGAPSSLPTETATEAMDRAGRTFFGAFDESGLAARMAWRDYDSWFGGRLVRTAGIASVTVAAEARGRGLLTPLFAATLSDAHAAGAVISTLFPSAAGIYRRFGYELVSDHTTVSLPSWVLAAVARPDAVTTRRAEVADVASIHRVYDRWAAAQNGPLSRRGVSFPATDESFLSDFTGVSVAVDAEGEICGFASWDRGSGYGPEAVLEVSDLLALQEDGYRALLAAMGSFVSVTPMTKIDTSGNDIARLQLATTDWLVTGSDPYMLAVLDVAGALTALSYPPGIDDELTFQVSGLVLPGADGTYVLRVAGGGSACEPAPAGGERVFAARGLALLYAGVQTCANLRFAGLLTGGDLAQDAVWDCLFGGRPMHIRDYF